MIETHEIKNSIELSEEADFVTEAISMVCLDERRLEEIKNTYDMLRMSVGSYDVGMWIQTQGKQRIAFGAAHILTDLSGKKSAWIHLIYARPAGNLRTVLIDVIIPWAKERGATKLQGCNEDFQHADAKDRWFNTYGMRRAFMVYERRI